jgi:hypothetical protein
MYIYRNICYYMYIISALGLRGLLSSRTPMEHHAHPLVCAHTILETTVLRSDIMRTCLPNLEQNVYPQLENIHSSGMFVTTNKFIASQSKIAYSKISLR